MAMTKNYPELFNDDDVLLGSGYLFLGDPGDTYDETKMQSVGCLSGTATLKLTVEKAVLEAGSPLMPIRVEPIRMGALLEVELIEMNPTRIARALGIGTVADAIASSPSVVDEEVEIQGKYFHHLAGYDITPATVVVTSNDATPVSYVEDTDYVIDYDNGLIRRTTTGSITSGDTILVDYDWSKPATSTLKVGSESSVDHRPLKYVVPMPDEKRLTFRMWMAAPQDVGDLPFQSEDFTKITISFIALADRTKTPEQMLFSLEKETA